MNVKLIWWTKEYYSQLSEMIRLSLHECKKLGIDRVFMVCDQSNIASSKTILKNGGILENEIADADGKIHQRYWIDLN